MTVDKSEAEDAFARASVVAHTAIVIKLLQVLQEKGVLLRTETEDLLKRARESIPLPPLASKYQTMAPGIIDHILGEVRRRSSLCN